MKINKMPEFYVILVRKILFPKFWGARTLLTRVPYSYAHFEKKTFMALSLYQA